MKLRAIPSTVWNAFVSLLDVANRTYIRYVHPKHAVAGWLALNVLISVAVWWSTKTWSDFFTVAGYWVTVSGLLVALFELYRARTVSERVHKALESEMRRQRGLHYRFWLELASGSLRQVRTEVHYKKWKAASIKLHDLTDALSRINAISPAADDFWKATVDGIHVWVVRFEAGKDNHSLPHDMVQWEQVAHSVSDRLVGELTVEQPDEEDENGPE